MRLVLSSSVGFSRLHGVPGRNKRGTGHLSDGNLLCLPGNLGVVGSATSCITYSSHWNPEKPNISATSNGSPFTTFQTSWTTTQGSKASLFFEGTGIAVEAIYPVVTDLPPAQVLFTVDSQTPVTATAFNGTDYPIPTSYAMFTSPVLSNGLHNLTMELMNTGNFTFHFLLVYGGGGLTNTNNAVDSSDTSVSSQSSGGIAAGSTSSARSVTPSTSSQMSSSPPSAHSNVGGIVGGVIGGLILLVVVVFALVFRRKRAQAAIAKEVQRNAKQTMERWGFEPISVGHIQNSAEYAATAEK